MELKTKVDKIVKYLEEKKAKDIEVMNITGMTVLADYFIVCSGTSTTHIKAMADEVVEKLAEEHGEHPNREGYDSARWILLDYGDIIVHVFHDEDRKFYNLERLWSDGLKNYGR